MVSPGQPQSICVTTHPPHAHLQGQVDLIKDGQHLLAALLVPAQHCHLQQEVAPRVHGQPDEHTHIATQLLLRSPPRALQQLAADGK